MDPEVWVLEHSPLPCILPLSYPGLLVDMPALLLGPLWNPGVP